MRDMDLHSEFQEEPGFSCLKIHFVFRIPQNEGSRD